MTRLLLAALAVAPAEVRLDAEIDPTAYALKGYSLHAGIEWERWRLDLGVFAIAVPQFIHGNQGFDSSFDGYGAKLQRFLFDEPKGAMVGVEGGVNRQLVQLSGTEAASRRTQYSIGVHAGWRFMLGAGFYATPWLGLSYSSNAGDVTVGGRTFKNSPWQVFPAVHFGRRF